MSKRRFKNDDYAEGYFQALSDLESKLPREDLTIYGGIVQHTERRKVELAYKQGEQTGFNALLREVRNITKEMKK